MSDQTLLKWQDHSWRRTFANAWTGLWTAFSGQKNFRIHLALSLLVLTLAQVFDLPLWQITVLILAIIWGLSMELINTLVEKIVDLITKDYHPQAKVIKDISAGLMLLTAIGLALLGLLILLPPLWNRLF